MKKLFNFNMALNIMADSEAEAKQLAKDAEYNFKEVMGHAPNPMSIWLDIASCIDCGEPDENLEDNDD